ncbi:complement C1q tumor necrosis factor-related protein 3-like [Saccostrea echinata]|uniref:complement C1q tumor necrosis factor-related protein 3-like n=1 Tax=Saccostrea echinata TaxID=191078 RepID=UPI002A831CB4|nr:complement C1q tumor necrosis factor-related protein 3-like [Saccostrea echinata]
MFRVIVLVIGCAAFVFGDDPSKLLTLEERMDKLERELNMCKSREPGKRASNPSSPVIAFSAYLSSDVHPLATNEAIIYNNVQLNEGNAYNAHVGRFQAPIGGIYHFVASAQSYSSDYIEIEIVRDTVTLCRGRGSQTYQSTGTCAATIHLSAGSDVWVRRYSGNYIRGNAYSAFTGHLVNAD